MTGIVKNLMCSVLPKSTLHNEMSIFEQILFKYNLQLVVFCLT
jgi:hypothetical protein